MSSSPPSSSTETHNSSEPNDDTNEIIENEEENDNDDETFHSVTYDSPTSSLYDSAVFACASPLFESAHSVGIDELEDDSLMDEADYEDVQQLSPVVCGGEKVQAVTEEQLEGTPIDVVKSANNTVDSKMNSSNKTDTPTKPPSAIDNPLQFSWKVISDETELERPNVNSVSLNQDKNCISVGTNLGYRVRTITPSGTGKIMIHESKINGGVSYCQMLHCTSLLAVVKTSSPRSLNMMNAKTGLSLCELFFVAAVRRVDMNRKILVVLSADGRLHSFDLGTMKLIKSIPMLHSSESVRLVSNPAASTAGTFFCLSTEEEDCWLCCRSCEDTGTVNVMDGRDMKLISKVKAHTHGIARLAIGGKRGGQRLATASEKGTVIRVFSIPQCEKLYTLWRGSKPCQIFSLSFSDTAKRLAASGSKGTIHIYNIGEGQQSTTQQTTSREHGSTSPTRLLKTAMENWHWNTSFPGLLPDSMTDKTESLRSFAKIKMKPDKIGGPISPNTIALVTCIEEGDSLVVATNKAKMYQFHIESNGVNRPIRADDLLFDDETVDGSNGKMLLSDRTK